jgi:hypothetical protein
MELNNNLWPKQAFDLIILQEMHYYQKRVHSDEGASQRGSG